MEYKALKEAKLREEGSDKEIHLMEFEEECIEEVDKGEFLVLRRSLIVVKSQTVRSNVRTYSTLDVPSMAEYGLLLRMVVVVQMWPLLCWLRNSNSRPSLNHNPAPFNGSTKVKDSKSLLVGWWLCQLVKVIKMSCGVTSFPWMLVIYH